MDTLRCTERSWKMTQSSVDGDVPSWIDQTLRTRQPQHHHCGHMSHAFFILSYLTPHTRRNAEPQPQWYFFRSCANRLRHDSCSANTTLMPRKARNGKPSGGARWRMWGGDDCFRQIPLQTFTLNTLRVGTQSAVEKLCLAQWRGRKLVEDVESLEDPAWWHP